MRVGGIGGMRRKTNLEHCSKALEQPADTAFIHQQRDNEKDTHDSDDDYLLDEHFPSLHMSFLLSPSAVGVIKEPLPAYSGRMQIRGK